MEEAKTIYCPNCGRKVLTYCGKGTCPVDAGCKKCRKRVVYYPEKDQTFIKDIPLRATGSGTRLWF